MMMAVCNQIIQLIYKKLYLHLIIFNYYTSFYNKIEILINNQISMYKRININL